MSAMEEAIVSTLVARELAQKVAAAREEQRTVVLRYVENTYDPDFDDIATIIKEAPLKETPLADTITGLRADLASAAAVIKELEARLENARGQLVKVASVAPTVAQAARTLESAGLSGGLSRGLKVIADDIADVVNFVLSPAEKSSGASTPQPQEETFRIVDLCTRCGLGGHLASACRLLPPGE